MDTELFISAAGNVTSEIVKPYGEEQKTRQGIEIKNAPVASKHIVIEPVQ